jgi:phosphatidylglycerol---prolipoprotein diacylglyceryl transferase
MNEFLFDRVAFHVGSLQIYWYGIILGFGAFMGTLLAIREGKRFGIHSDFFIDLLMIGAPSAIIVARIYYVAFEWQTYQSDWLQIFNIRNGGIAIHGALIGGILGAIWHCRRRGYSFWHIADIAAPSLLVGQLIGRWGNFTNQEAHGGPVSEAFLRDTLHLPRWIVDQMHISGVYYHPTFLYESLWNLVGLLLIMVLRRQSFVRVGEVFLGYLAWYSVGRYYIEGLRTDSLAFHGPTWLANAFEWVWQPMTWLFGEQGAIPGDANMRAAQTISVGILLVVIVLIGLRRMSGGASRRYMDAVERRY